MSKYTNYVIQAQELNITQAAIYNALSARAFNGTSICWPSRKDISQITKIKKLQTITDNLPKLIEQGHVVRLGELVHKNQTRCNMYWVNNGDNDVVKDVKHMINELNTGAGAALLKDEMMNTLNGFLNSYPQAYPTEGYTPTPQKDMGVPQKRVGVYPAKGYGNININSKENLIDLYSDTNYFDQLSSDQKMKIGNIKIKPNLHNLLAGIIFSLPESDSEGRAIIGNPRFIAKTLKQLDADMGNLDTDLILNRLMEDVEHHNKLKSGGDFSNFYTVQSWLEDHGWKSDNYRQAPKPKKQTNSRTGKEEMPQDRTKSLDRYDHAELAKISNETLGMDIRQIETAIVRFCKQWGKDFDHVIKIFNRQYANTNIRLNKVENHGRLEKVNGKPRTVAELFATVEA
jgi:hypothetical protein